MASFFKKPSIKVSSGRSGGGKSSGKFPSVSSPKLKPLKTRIYTKDVLKSDPSQYGGIGFGNTGLEETPSLLGMSKSAGFKK